jgi:uncharacterized protein YqgC (DUF456 family)
LSYALPILAALILLIATCTGVVLTILTLPGVWLILIVALLCQWAFGQPYLFDWWTLGAAAALALVGEIFEFASGAIGAKRAGGGRSGAVGSILGALIGAVAGSLLIPIPLVGTLVGVVAGAGLGAILLELGIAGREWSHALRIGTSAATSRAAAVLVKGGITAAVGLLLAVAAIVK